MSYLGTFGLEFEKAIISTLEFFKNESLTHTVNFCIGSAFSKGPWSGFSKGPGPGPRPLYKVCHVESIQEAAKLSTDKQYKYRNLLKAYQIALTIPVLVVSSELYFSKLKIAKNYLRSAMDEEKLDALIIGTCSTDVLDNLDLEKLANAWSLLKTRRIKI